ncbi:AP2 domain transcription factor, putative, partial [Hepatocystis sp. ex Piliocolobus tephrosceles]
MSANIMTKSGKIVKNFMQHKRNLCTLSKYVFSKHPYKPKTKEVIHPHITPPEYMKPSSACFDAKTSGLQQYLPKNYYRAKWIESLRSGEFLGEDYPWCLLPNWKYWKKRKYNITYNKIPW